MKFPLIMKLHPLFYALLLFLFSACEQDNVPKPADKLSRTVLVYMMGDNSLSGFIADDIKEMMKGMESVDVSQYNLLVYVDELGNGTPTLYRLSKGPDGVVAKAKLKEYKEHVSADPAVFEEVLNRTFAEYPADSYGLVLWSHGEGWIPSPLPVKKDSSTRWIGQDGSTYLNITDIASVLSKLPHLSFLLIDACFGQSVEVAYELRDCVDYIIGSPTEIPGPGASYDKVVPAMFVASDVGVELGKAYFEPYEAKYNEAVKTTNTNWTGGVSVSVIKCAALDNLASVTKATFTSSPVSLNTLLSSNLYNYDRRPTGDSYYVGYYDMKQLMPNLLLDMDAWTSALNDAVIYWRSTAKNYSSSAGMFPLPQETTCGVSHYIPKSLDAAATVAYRSTAWYKAAGLEKNGW